MHRMSSGGWRKTESARVTSEVAVAKSHISQLFHTPGIPMIKALQVSGARPVPPIGFDIARRQLFLTVPS